MTGNDLVDKEKEKKNSDQLKIIIRKKGIAGPKESQKNGSD